MCDLTLILNTVPRYIARSASFAELVSKFVDVNRDVSTEPHESSASLLPFMMLRVCQVIQRYGFEELWACFLMAC